LPKGLTTWYSLGPLLPRMAILPGLNLMEKILSGLEKVRE